MVRVLLAAACLLALATPVRAQSAAGDPVRFTLTRFERVLATADRDAFPALFAESVDDNRVEQLGLDLLKPGIVQAALRERSRAPMEGVPPGDGYRLVVDFFIATAGRGRVLTAGLDIQRPSSGDLTSWRIVDWEGLTSVDGLFKLRLNLAKPLTARMLRISSEDMTLALDDGTAYLVECDEGVTGLVLLGRGEMRFAPTPTSEQGQLKLFAGATELAAAFDSAFVRMSPSDYRRRVSGSLNEAVPQQRLARRAEEVFDRESPKSFSVDLQDMSRDQWHLLPPSEDFLADVDTRRFDTLTYARSSVQAEDVSLFQRKERRTIALYASAAKIAARGRFYSDDTLRDYDVLDYNVDVAVDPERRSIQSRARLTIRIRGTSVTSVMLRLSESLNVASVTSVEYGPLLHLRVRGQNAVLVSLPRVAPQDSDLTLVIGYSGTMAPQELDVDNVQVSRDGPVEPTGFSVEPNFLLSNRSNWYPQNPIPDYATATVRCTVPRGFGCVASGTLQPPQATVSLQDIVEARTDGQSSVFRADQPLRYLAFIVSRFTRAAERTVMLDRARTGGDIDRVDVIVQATPRQVGRGRQLVGQVEDIVKFYSGLVGDAPYATATVALVESELPGGHSPGYFAVLNDPVPNPNVTWRNDPASFDTFPEFFIAHEFAHQWWGQAVGWKNYHEQWLSEGFAQYFAALYAQRTRGDRVFTDMLRQFRRWAMSQSDQGPIYLGYRLGHLENDLRVYRALVYNKGAGVLHMLRRLLGDETFFRALGRFYADRRFQKAGTDDLQRVFEAESGRPLGRFFERWIYETGIPRVRFSWRSSPGAVTVSFVQTGRDVYDLPVTVTIVHTDGRSRDIVVQVTDTHVEQTIPVDAPVREIQVNRDSAAIAEFSDS